MANTININGHDCRWFFAGKCWVSSDGNYAYQTKVKGKKESLKITSTNTGKFFRCYWTGSISMAQAVITCFCPPKPQDGQKYVVGYKDGNVLNCDYHNLEWVVYQYPHTTAKSTQLYRRGLKVTVYKDGTIKIGRDVLYVSNEMWDADTDAGQAWRPHVHIDGEMYYVEDLMEDAAYIQGDPTGLQDPVILHKDNNWMNFASDNLEWVERTDPRRTAYETHGLQDMNDLTRKINLSGRYPDNYIKTKLPQRFKGWGY